MVGIGYLSGDGTMVFTDDSTGEVSTCSFMKTRNVLIPMCLE